MLVAVDGRIAVIVSDEERGTRISGPGGGGGLALPARDVDHLAMRGAFHVLHDEQVGEPHHLGNQAQRGDGRCMPPPGPHVLHRSGDSPFARAAQVMCNRVAFRREPRLTRD